MSYSWKQNLKRELKYDSCKFKKMSNRQLMIVLGTLYKRFENFRLGVIDVYIENDYLRRKYGFERRKKMIDNIKQE